MMIREIITGTYINKETEVTEQLWNWWMG